MSQQLLSDLARVKALFQKRTVLTVMGFEDNGELVQSCGICGDFHEVDRVPFACETGDGV